jgi:hypothetical protein
MNSEVTDLTREVAASARLTTREDFFLLSDIVPEDKELRRRLQMERLEQVSEQTADSECRVLKLLQLWSTE